VGWHYPSCDTREHILKFKSNYTVTGCLQLLEILEISWNLKTLLEISWKLFGPTGNFCVRYRRSTALVSSHKNMDKYSSEKYEIYRHQMCSFKFQMHQNPFSDGASPWTPEGELMMLPQIPIWLGRGHRELTWCPLRRRPKQGKHVLDFS